MPATPASFTSGRVLNVALWTAQIVLFAAFTWAAFEKIATPIAELARMWPWVATMPSPYVRLLGVIDLAGGVGVLAPSLTRIKPGLTVIAAIGCCVLQLCATVFHASRAEIAVLPVNLVFLGLATFIAWGRWPRPVHPRR